MKASHLMALISNPAAVMFSTWDANYTGFNTVSGTFKREIILKCKFISFRNMCANSHKMSARYIKNWQESVIVIAWAVKGLEIKISTWKNCHILSGSYTIYMVCRSHL